MTAASRFLTAVRIVASAALVVFVAGVPLRLIVGSFDPFEPYPGHVAPYGITRSRAVRAVIPEIASRSEKQVVLLGSSGLARAFVPSVFDAALAEDGDGYVSFNLAQVLLQPETALATAQAIRQTYEARNKRIAITLFGVSVPELHRDALRAANKSVPDQAFVFATPRGLAGRVRTDPLGALEDGLDLVFYGNIRPERVALWIEDARSSRRPGCESGLKQPPDGAEAQAALDDFCAALRLQFPRGVPPWNPSTRGAFDFGLPATRPMLERLVALQATATAAPLVAPAPRGPVPPFAINEDAVKTLVAAVKELHAVSDVTFVLRDVLNPAMIETAPPEHVATWRAIAERIAVEGDATLLDLNDGTVAAADFGDRTHLNPLAAERFSSHLAARVRSMLQERRAHR